MHTGRIWGFSVEKWRTESHKKNVKYSSISGGQTLTPCKSPLGSSRKVPPTLFGYPWVRTTSWANNLSLVLRVPFPLLFPGASQQQLINWLASLAQKSNLKLSSITEAKITGRSSRSIFAKTLQIFVRQWRTQEIVQYFGGAKCGSGRGIFQFMRRQFAELWAIFEG